MTPIREDKRCIQSESKSIERERDQAEKKVQFGCTKIKSPRWRDPFDEHEQSGREMILIRGDKRYNRLKRESIGRERDQAEEGGLSVGF